MKHLFYIFIAVLLAGCAENGGKADMASATTPYDSIIQANGYEALPLFKTRTGHITVSLQVNGKPCVFLVDTGGGATLIDISKKDLYQLEPQAIRDYAAGIGSASPLVRTTGVFGINGMEISFTSPGLVSQERLSAMGLDIPSCGACLSNMAITPSGNVVPCQSWLSDEPLGNILMDKWKKIWNGPLCKKIRENSAKEEQNCQLRER